MNMTVSVKERIPKQRTERRAYVTERARESDSLLVRTDRPQPRNAGWGTPIDDPRVRVVSTLGEVAELL